MAGARLIFRRLATAGALCLSGSGIAAGTDDALLYDALDDCIDTQFQHSPAPDSFDKIDLAVECPDLLLSLIDSDWVDRTALLSPDFPNLAQLADLRHFLHGAQASPENSLPLDYSRLVPILADTLDGTDHHLERSWWRRLLDWLRRRHRTRDDGDLRWLEELLDSLTLPKTAAEYLAWGVAAMLILLATAMVINEIRAARAGRPALRSRTTARSRAPSARAAGGAGPGAQQLPGKAPELLNRCIDHLIRVRRLPDCRSRTNREFLHHLRRGGDSAAPGFEYLLQQAECVLYGGWRLDAPTLQQCRVAAAALLGVPAADAPGAPPADAELRQ
jgi:hypothetical protein